MTNPSIDNFDIAATMAAVGLDSPIAVAEPLTGGVSSDIWRVELADGTSWCVKRALPVLRTEAHWEAPVERSAAEADWLAEVGEQLPGLAPRLIGYDAERRAMVMELVTGGETWKQRLLAGDTAGAVAVAGTVGEALHALRTRLAAPALRERFDHAEQFDALRLDPYLRHTAERHAGSAAVVDRLAALERRFGDDATAVVHGDVSPKNLLVVDGRVVLLDAECAAWGDPAFDVAFCLTHLCAKAIHLDAMADLASAARRLVTTAGVADDRRLDKGVARWLPALLLARVDGASPLEYLDEATRSTIRDRAVDLLCADLDCTVDTLATWFG